MRIIGSFVSTACLMVLCMGHLDAQQHPQINYLNCAPPPVDSPVVFARGIVSLKDRWEEKICFTPDGKEVFYGIHPDPKDYFRPSIMHATFEGGQWSEAKVVPFSKNRLVGWPLLNPQGTVLFMEEIVGKIAYSTKRQGSWSELEYLVPDIEAKEGFGLAQITNDNTFYFYDRSEHVAYYSKVTDGEHSKPKPLSYKINPAVEFFVSRQNDYIIFLPISFHSEFHISFGRGGDNWTLPLPLSSYFKGKSGWNCKGGAPYVSPDNKYFFFVNHGDIYWVGTDFIEALKKQSRTK